MSVPFKIHLAPVLAFILLAGCAHLQSPLWVQDTLYFGLSSPRGAVTEKDWDTFLSQEVTPRFPQGLSTWKASGQWREASGTIEHEDSRVLLILHPDDRDADANIQALREVYKRSFHQQSVLRVRQRVNADF